MKAASGDQEAVIGRGATWSRAQSEGLSFLGSSSGFDAYHLHDLDQVMLFHCASTFPSVTRRC